MNLSKVAMKLCWDHTAAWEFSWICSISAEHLFERCIWGTASVSLTQDFVSPIRHRVPYDLCLIAGYKGIAIMTITGAISLVF